MTRRFASSAVKVSLPPIIISGSTLAMRTSPSKFPSGRLRNSSITNTRTSNGSPGRTIDGATTFSCAGGVGMTRTCSLSAGSSTNSRSPATST